MEMNVTRMFILPKKSVAKWAAHDMTVSDHKANKFDDE